MSLPLLRGVPFLALAFILAAAVPAYARDAAFLSPSSGNASGDEAVRVDPKPDIDVGDSPLNVAKRVSIFFVNQSDASVKIEKIAVNGDSNVTAEETSDDCMKQGTLAAGSRCAVEISVTPTGPGSWNVDVLMTHDGAGRLARARISGKTGGNAGAQKETGLAVSGKEVKPIDFGTVDVGSGKIVRSTLMVNDSSETITLYAIDVIAADNGLQRLDQGCEIDMELPPGASCPVTLLWQPASAGPISTDLIIRHSGRLGFAVVPVRGEATDLKADAAALAAKAGAATAKDVPPPPTAMQLEKEMAGHVAPVSGAALAPSASSGGGGDGHLHLVGTVGERALFILGDGTSSVVPVGTEFQDGDRTVKLVSMTDHSADIDEDGKKRTLRLEASAALVKHAAQEQASEEEQEKSGGASGGSGAHVSGGRTVRP